MGLGMIKALGSTDGKPCVLLGMTLEDLEPLKPGNGEHCLKIDLGDLGMELCVTLIIGEDLESLVGQFDAMKSPQTLN